MQLAGRNAEAVAQNRGLLAIVVLAVLTAVEFVVAVGIDSTVAVVVLLAVLGVAKAWIIVQIFMHVAKLWRGEEDHA
jgi:hypothetical protein